MIRIYFQKFQNIVKTKVQLMECKVDYHKHLKSKVKKYNNFNNKIMYNII